MADKTIATCIKRPGKSAATEQAAKADANIIASTSREFDPAIKPARSETENVPQFHLIFSTARPPISSPRPSINSACAGVENGWINPV